MILYNRQILSRLANLDRRTIERRIKKLQIEPVARLECHPLYDATALARLKEVTS